MDYYRELLRQKSRVEPFRRAIQSVVGPKDRVLEVGTGLGTYSFFAADAGAAQVWAVEGEAVAHVAETVSRLNGYGDKIEFVRGWLPDVSLPERATVLIYEDFPSRLLDSGTYRLLDSLFKDYLTPDALVLPQRGRLLVAPTSISLDAVSGLAPLGDGDEFAYDIDWHPTREYVFNTPHHVKLPAETMAAAPAVLADIPFRGLPEVEELGGTASWVFGRETVVSGLLYWFELEVVPGELISNAPGALPGSWGQIFLPLDPPITVGTDEELSVSVKPERLAGGVPGWLCWSATAGNMEARGHEFAARPSSFADLCTESPDGVPRLDARGRLEAKVLQLTDGKRSIGDIAAVVRMDDPRMDQIEAERLVVRVLTGKLERQTLSEVTFSERAKR